MYKIIGANQAEYGPVTAEQIRQWIAENRVNAETSAQLVGETEWRAISKFPEFAASFPAAAVPPPFAQSPPPPQSPQPPSFSAGPGENFSRAKALDEVNGPAIGLMIVGILGIVYAAFALLAQMTGMTFNSFEQFNQLSGRNFPNPEFFRMTQMWGGVMGVIGSFMHAALAGLTLYGALKMKNLENHSLAIAAAIVALIPCFCPCCFIGIPMGIWALVVLNKPEVRAHFN